MQTYATLADADAAAEAIGRERYAAILTHDAEMSAAFDLTPCEEEAMRSHTARLMMPHIERMVLSTLAGPVTRWYLTANRLTAPVYSTEGQHTHAWPGGLHTHDLSVQEDS